ncbi:MAG TPA: DUF1772 domain-containing protein [Gemmatimonadota bacterium]|nr:DUF1772 domain-containing protein [Gemmatimonadota bacterium]
MQITERPQGTRDNVCMSRRVSKLLLWLLVLNLGIAFGAGLYESRIVFPRWLEDAYHWNAEAARADNTGLRFWVYVTTVPLTLITFANLVAAWRHRGDARSWWLSSSVVTLAERASTFSYFIPTMIALTGNGMLPSEAADEARRWELLNYLRHALVLVAWLLALKAFGALHREGRVLV